MTQQKLMNQWETSLPLYNEEQLAIINSAASRLIVNASAGTGKTHTLIGYANARQDYKMALITFTKKAAEEMAERLTFYPYFVGTLHSFALNQLNILAKAKGFRVRFMKEPQIKAVLRFLLEEGELIQYVNDRIVNEAYSFIIFRTEFEESYKMKLFYHLKSEYIQYKEENLLYDFTDAPKYLLEKLEFYDHRLNLDYLLVDEAQDLDDIQYRLLDRLSPNIMAIGDPRQSIYLFRGATPEIFSRFEKDGYIPYTLTFNYRSKQEIIDEAGAQLKCIRGTGGVVNKSVRLIDFGPQILCRTNKEVKDIARYYHRVSTIHAAKGLEFDNVLISNFEIQNPEDQNVMFVAKTRAKNNLSIVEFCDIISYMKGE